MRGECNGELFELSSFNPVFFLEIFRNEITTILTPSTSEGGDICIRSYDTGRSFDPIFMKFTWLVRVHSGVNPIVFGNNRPNRTTYMGKNVPQNQFFGLKSDEVF